MTSRCNLLPEPLSVYQKIIKMFSFVIDGRQRAIPLECAWKMLLRYVKGRML